MPVFRPSLLAFLVSSLSVQNALAADAETATENAHRLEPMVITAPVMADVLTVTTDPKAPRQPVPAHDGADYLKSIPGFSVTRKGGTDGDPVFRGMAASRLSILLDGQMILGGCGGRMDPPTAYVFPQAYDQVTVLKGPQTVKYGPGNSAGVVMFERTAPDFSTTPVQGEVSLLAASADRNDQVAHLLAGNQKGYIDVNGTRTDANNYKDGDGNEVHSAYTRWSTNAALGWTPDADTRIELSGAQSDGEARYGDRGMDGAAFERSNMALSFEKKDISPLLAEVKGQVYRNYIDHVMDNYSLRNNGGMKMASNPDRDTKGASLAATLNLSEHTGLEVGADTQKNQHRFRGAKSMTTTPDYDNLPRNRNMLFKSHGLYAELEHHLNADSSVYTGLRINKDSAEDLRSSSPTKDKTDNNTLKNAFVRYEQQLDTQHRIYAGLGLSERSADFWERMKSSESDLNAFTLDTEKTNQLDIGLLHQEDEAQLSVSAFYAKHKDYILIEKISGKNGVFARNIDASTWGAEVDSMVRIGDNWNSTATLAWVHGRNNSDSQPLGQMPPLEARFGMNYDNGLWSAGALWRLVDEQNRVAEGTGNIVGQDIDKSAGFNVFSLNAGYRPMNDLLLTAGIDNLFDITYAEHISKAGADIAGYEQMTRINEPGRTLWLKMQWAFK